MYPESIKPKDERGKGETCMHTHACMHACMHFICIHMSQSRPPLESPLIHSTKRLSAACLPYLYQTTGQPSHQPIRSKVQHIPSTEPFEPSCLPPSSAGTANHPSFQIGGNSGRGTEQLTLGFCRSATTVYPSVWIYVT